MHAVLALIRKISNEVRSSVMGSFKCYYTLLYLCVYVYLCWPVSPEMQTDTGPGKISMMD